MHLRKLALSVLILTIFALNGCGGGGGGGGSSPLNANLGSLAGNVYVTAANALIVSQSTSPPAGDHAAAGATVTIGNVTTKTDGHGAFQLNGVAPGEGNVTISLAAANAVVPVTVFGGVVAQLGPPAVTRQAAYATAQAALNGVATLDTNTEMVLGPQEPLPAGTVVTPALGDDTGQPNAADNYTVKTPQWLFYADPVSYLREQHAVYFYFVDASTGVLTTMTESSSPIINGLTYYGIRDADPTSPDVLKPPAAAKGQPARSFTSTGAPNTTVVPHAGGTTYALLIEGADESDQNADIKNIQTLFGRGGLPPPSTYQCLPGGVAPPGGFGKSPRLNQINTDFQTICQKALPQDTVFLYITGHGLKSGGVQLDSKGTFKDGTPVTFESLYASNFDFSKTQACNVIIIIDACYSGKMLSQFSAALTKQTCKNWTVMSAADATHESVGIPVWDPRGATGGMFTNAFIAAFNAQLTATPNAPVNIPNAYDAADQSLAGSVLFPDAGKQNPQFASGKAGASCPCNPVAMITPEDTWCNSNDDTIYVADYGSDNVGVIPGTYTSTGYTFSVSTVVPVGNGPHAITGDPGTNQVYVANSDGTLSVIDATNDTMTKTLSTVGSCPGGLMADNAGTGFVYVANDCSGTVSVIDAHTDTVTGTVNVGTMPIGIQVDPVLNEIFVATSNGIVVINGSTNQIANTISLPGTSPAGLDIDVSTHTLYVVNSVNGTQTVTVINDSTDKVIAPSTITLGTQPYYIAVNSSSGYVYVSNTASNSVSVMDGINYQLVKTLPTGRGPGGLGLFGTLDLVYVPNATDDSLTLINGQTNTVTSTLLFP